MPPPHQGEGDKRSTDQIELWKASAPRIEQILPGFLAEAIPPVAPEPAAPAASAAVESAPVAASAAPASPQVAQDAPEAENAATEEEKK